MYSVRAIVYSSILGLFLLGSVASEVVARGLADGVGERSNAVAYPPLDIQGAAVPYIFTPPSGTTLYHSAEACTNLSGSSNTWTDVFTTGDLSFTTGMASSVVEVHFSSQASIGAGNVENRIYFKCTTSQDSGATWTNCTGQNATNGVILARNVKDVNGASTTYQVSTNPGVYIGRAAVDADTPTLLRLQVRNQNTGNGTSTVCFPNLIVRY